MQGVTTSIGLGYLDRLLTHDEIASVLDQAFAEWDLDGKRVLVVIPDGTRTCPLDVMFPLVYERLADRVGTLEVLLVVAVLMLPAALSVGATRDRTAGAAS